MSYLVPQPTNIRYCFSQYTEALCGVKSLLFPINLSDVDVVIYVIDKFQKEYSFFAHADADGFIELDLTLFPAGLFNPYAGNFTIYATLAGFPKSERLFFRSTAGYFPGLELRIVESLPINYQQFDKYYTDTDKFTCCCQFGKTRCANITIDACTGESLIPTPITPGGSSGSSGGGGNNPPPPCVPGLTYSFQNSWQYEPANGVNEFDANIIPSSDPLWVPDYTIKVPCDSVFGESTRLAFLVFNATDCCLTNQDQKMVMANAVKQSFGMCDGLPNSQITILSSPGNLISPVTEFAVKFTFYPSPCVVFDFLPDTFEYSSSSCGTINIPECNFMQSMQINLVTIEP